MIADCSLHCRASYYSSYRSLEVRSFFVVNFDINALIDSLALVVNCFGWTPMPADSRTLLGGMCGLARIASLHIPQNYDHVVREIQDAMQRAKERAEIGKHGQQCERIVTVIIMFMTSIVVSAGCFARFSYCSPLRTCMRARVCSPPVYALARCDRESFTCVFVILAQTVLAVSLTLLRMRESGVA